MGISAFLSLLRYRGEIPEAYEVDQLRFNTGTVPVKNGIPRFTPDISYCTGNFSKLREQYATLQLDSHNGTADRLLTVLGRTNWPKDYFVGKTVLECGCGAGPDTEILLQLGAKVLSVDLAGLDIASANLGDRPDLALMQADIADLPLVPHSFDIVFCHRVIQHTPDPERVLDHILRFVKPDGAAFVHSYSHGFVQMVRWKYLLRPITRRMEPERLFRLIERMAPRLFAWTDKTNRFWPARIFNWIFVPFINHSGEPEFKNSSRAFLMNTAIHDTFDALSPRYDRPLRARTMRRIASQHLERPFEIVTRRTITLLRTRLH